MGEKNHPEHVGSIYEGQKIHPEQAGTGIEGSVRGTLAANFKEMIEYKPEKAIKRCEELGITAFDSMTIAGVIRRLSGEPHLKNPGNPTEIMSLVVGTMVDAEIELMKQPD